MRGLGPWPAGPPVAVAVSGGADSLALALLVRNWSPVPPLALVVDHRVRDGSTGEALRTIATLDRLAIPSRLLTLDGLHPGSRLQERARAARHAALARACAADGLLDLLIGHHRADQDETIRMRARASSGPAGLAGMAMISERNALRLIRPLLDVPPERLRATLRAASIPWVEDPANRDPRFERARIRLAPKNPLGPAVRPDHAAQADWLARHIAIHEAGWALLPRAPLPPAALSRLLQSLAGAEHPPGRAATERLARDPRPATLHGIRLMDAGRFGPSRSALIACREPDAMQAACPARPATLWDGRFRLCASVSPGWTIGPLGHERPHRGTPELPGAVLPSLPALRDPAGRLRAVPHLGLYDPLHEIDVIFSPHLPLAPSFFINADHSVSDTPWKFSGGTGNRLPDEAPAP